MKITKADSGGATFDDLSYSTLTTLEQQIIASTRDVAATEGALVACQASVSQCEVRRDTLRAQADAAKSRLGDAKNAAASVLGAVKLSHGAHLKAITVQDNVFQLLNQTSKVAALVLAAAESVDELVDEVETYRKNHLVSDVLQDGVAKAETVAQTLVSAAVGAVEGAMSAYLAASQAATAAAAVPRQGIELWGHLVQRDADPLTVKGVSTLVLGSPAVDSIEDLARIVASLNHSSSAGHPPVGLLPILADIDQVMTRHLRELETSVSQGQLKINSLDQLLANHKAALRSAQLALDGARAALGSQF